MIDVLRLVAAAALAFGVVAVAVVGGHDTTVLVPPPESVAEQFMRHVTTGRYDRALQYVAPSARVPVSTLRLMEERLRARAGPINQVEGEPGAMTRNDATASVRLATERAGDVRWTFTLARRAGMWRITGWQDGG